MRCLLLNELATFRAASSVSTITQPQSGWRDLRGCGDLLVWLHVTEITLGGATAVTLAYQTSPTADDAGAAGSLFVNMSSASSLATGVTTAKLLMATATNPLARYLRWQLGFTGSATANWGATFRIWVAVGHPTSRPMFLLDKPGGVVDAAAARAISHGRSESPTAGTRQTP